jgi:hypothetical protein
MSRKSELIDKVHVLLKSDRRLTTREMSEKVGISIGSCHAIVTEDLDMRQVAAKFIPRVLTAEQEENHLFAATDLLQCTESDADFLGNIITGNETCIYSYDPETKAQS